MSNSKKAPSTTSDDIIEWLKNHPLINKHALCQSIGYNSANLQNAIEGRRSLPQKHAKAMADILTHYGFQ